MSRHLECAIHRNDYLFNAAVGATVGCMSRKEGTARGSTYHSPLRARQAEQTRSIVLAAATRMFTEHGWSTTMGALAAEAGTAVETIYSGFGSKVGLLIAAIDAAIVGDEDSGALTERPEFTSLASGESRARLQAGVAIITQALVRAVPLMSALQEAAGGDAKADARLEQYESDRHATIAAGIQLVVGQQTADELIDAIWAVAGPEVFAKLTRDRRWSVEQYQQWLTTVVGNMLGIEAR